MTIRRMVLETEMATIALARDLAARAVAGDVLLLSGPLGAGKSTLARALIRTLADDPTLEVPSPSFTLVQSYDLTPPVAHFDLWRLSGPADVEELGFEAALSGIVLVEWPDRLGDWAPAGAVRIALAWDEGERRVVTLDGPDRLVS
jgi:tRNA threonylcarbamoyladenosine biosynthesis protein TsaE